MAIILTVKKSVIRVYLLSKLCICSIGLSLQVIFINNYLRSEYYEKYEME